MILTWAVTTLLFGSAFCNDSTYPKHGRAARTKMYGVENLVYNSRNRKSSLILGTVLNKIAFLKNILHNKLRTFLRLKESSFDSKPHKATRQKPQCGGCNNFGSRLVELRKEHKESRQLVHWLFGSCDRPPRGCFKRLCHHDVRHFQVHLQSD